MDSSTQASIKLTYLGHSAALIQTGRANLLLDPVFSGNVLFFKRSRALGYNPAKLPEPDIVLISHAHPDHLDFPSFNYVRTKAPVVAPKGTAGLLRRHLPNPIFELAYWASHDFGNGLKVHAVPAIHSNFRYFPFFKRKACGYVIEDGGKTVYFAGDSAYGKHFRDIGNSFTIDAAMLPIGSYRPGSFMKKFHIDPVEAVQAFLDTNAKVMIPIHWGTFNMSLERMDEPIEWLKRVVSERGLGDKVRILASGEETEI